jgi:hypothetical protein
MIPCIIMSISHALFAIFQEKVIWLGVIGTGIAYGGNFHSENNLFKGIFGSALTILSFLFGVKHYGTNNGILVLGPAIGGFVFTFISGKIYDSHVIKMLRK